MGNRGGPQQHPLLCYCAVKSVSYNEVKWDSYKEFWRSNAKKTLLKSNVDLDTWPNHNTHRKAKFVQIIICLIRITAVILRCYSNKNA